MSHYKPYPVYKDSGVEWLGPVPEHWSVKPFKVCIDFQEGPGIMAADFCDGGIPLLRVAGVQDRWASLDGCNYLRPDKVERQWRHFRLEQGDLLISASASMGTVCEVADETAGAIAYTGLIRLRGKRDVMLRAYIRSLVVSDIFSTQIEFFKAGSTIQHFGPTHLSQMFVVCPPLDEQQAIAAHLNRETARIDAMVAKKTRFIELLREKRQALITHAVTKGLDPNVKMKDSGVEWLGEVPEHWVVSPVRYAVKPQAGAIKTGPFGSQLTANEMLGGSFKVYNQKNVIEGDLSSGDNYISDEKFAQLSSFRVLPGDVLVTTRGTIGRVCVVPDEIEPGILHPCLMRVQIDEEKMEKEFFAALLGESHILQSQISYLSNASTIEVIYSETMGSLVVPIPPLCEQRSILEFIQTHASKLDSLIQTSERSINLLKERRSALITAAVTGQIDLREAV